ncbi:MAG: hypothetical protein ACI8ZF_000396 [Candidatus Midichloriaceae bacterium]|jgi:hypothetical protein
MDNYDFDIFNITTWELPSVSNELIVGVTTSLLTVGGAITYFCYSSANHADIDSQPEVAPKTPPKGDEKSPSPQKSILGEDDFAASDVFNLHNPSSSFTRLAMGVQGGSEAMFAAVGLSPSPRQVVDEDGSVEHRETSSMERAGLATQQFLEDHVWPYRDAEGSAKEAGDEDADDATRTLFDNEDGTEGTDLKKKEAGNGKTKADPDSNRSKKKAAKAAKAAKKS